MILILSFPIKFSFIFVTFTEFEYRPTGLSFLVSSRNLPLIVVNVSWELISKTYRRFTRKVNADGV